MKTHICLSSFLNILSVLMLISCASEHNPYLHLTYIEKRPVPQGNPTESEYLGKAICSHPIIICYEPNALLPRNQDCPCGQYTPTTMQQYDIPKNVQYWAACNLRIELQAIGCSPIITFNKPNESRSFVFSIRINQLCARQTKIASFNIVGNTSTLFQYRYSITIGCKYNGKPVLSKTYEACATHTTTIFKVNPAGMMVDLIHGIIQLFYHDLYYKLPYREMAKPA
jgi:hypothetical protein